MCTVIKGLLDFNVIGKVGSNIVFIVFVAVKLKPSECYANGDINCSLFTVAAVNIVILIPLFFFVMLLF